MTAQEQEQLRSMSTAHVRRNYWLCDEQIKMCGSQGPRLDSTAATLQEWQDIYLGELVRRGKRI